MRDQRIRDPIHNLIKFSSNNPDDVLLWKLIQTPQIQRLRRIKQLGFSDFVFPGASHNRFSHSVGAMEMARGMLNIFAKKDSNYDFMRRATLCAVLLHDVGHGPYSHTFENVSSELGIKKDHEEFTEQMISDTEIAGILKEDSQDLSDQVLKLLKQDPGINEYSCIVSSQLDADRLDFLIRDRYFTGVKFGAIDLEWLFDSLKIREVIGEEGAKQHFFCFSEKGLSVAEDFLTAYQNMYSTIYYHKITRAVEVMIVEILKGIFGSEENRGKLPKNNELRRYFESGPNPDLEIFTELDDSAILNVIRWATKDSSLGEPFELANRYLKRDLFKAFEPPKEQWSRVNKFKALLVKEEISVYQDKPSSKFYKEKYDEEFVKNIFVFDPLARGPVALATRSEIAKALHEKPPTTRLYFKNVEEKERALKIWNSM